MVKVFVKLNANVAALTLSIFVAGASSAHGQTCAAVRQCGDVDDSGLVTTSDALKVLRLAVGQPETLQCDCALEPPPPPVCKTGGVLVKLDLVVALPQDMAGIYDEAFDCLESEGAGLSGEVDSTHCFRKGDGSSWRIWNTGCGWEIGRIETEESCGWERYARTYTGYCDEIPPEQLDTRALITLVYFDSTGDPIDGILSEACFP